VRFTYLTLIFLLFEKFEIKSTIGKMSVLSKPHQMPVCFLTISLTFSIQLSNCLYTLNINFDLLLPVTVVVSISELTPTVLHLELSRACCVFFVCLSLLTKPPFVFQITVWVCLFVTSTVAEQLTAHPQCSSDVSPN
jgi:hypothetical protein